ncbi:MAG: hypothetical protein CSA07_05440 [Bacteroidia bacterium]|nr:MAG: hypothetical protein CSA07_05440 [Bacteroidia bacterium]
MKVYLEFKDGASDKFWAIEVSGCAHTVRFGRSGTEGQEKVKEFASEGEAKRDAEKLVAAKRRKGYVDAAPPAGPPPPTSEMLDCEPLPGGRAALFVEVKLKPLNDFRAKFWKRQMDALLRDTMYDGSYRLESTQRLDDLSAEFEVIAAWTVPGMPHEVERDAQGLISAIRYRINGMEVLSLQRDASEAGWLLGSIRPFFLHERERGFLFGRKRDVIEGTRRLLSRYAAYLAEQVEVLEGAELEHSKGEKIRAVAEGNIAILAQDLMHGAGYTYALEEKEKSVRLYIRLHAGSDARCLELSLPHRTFPKRIADVMPTVAAVERLLAEVGVPFLLGNADGAPEWGSVELTGDNEYFLQSKTADPRRVKLVRMGQEALRLAFPSLLEGSGYGEYSLELRSGFHLYRDASTDESCMYPAILHVKMPQRKVLHLLFDYETFTDYLPAIVPTIRLVEATMASAPLAFKYHSTRYYQYESLAWHEPGH